MAGRPRRNTRSRRPSPPGTTQRARPARTRWWNRLTKSVVTSMVTVGAVAGAIGTVVSLWPSPDADDSAEVAVRIVHGIPLSEYQRRVESAGVVALKGYSPPDGEEAPEQTGDAEPGEDESPTRTADPDPTGTPTSTRADPSAAPASTRTGSATTVEPTSTPDAEKSTRATNGSGGHGPSATEFIVVDPPAGAEEVALDDVKDAYQQANFGAVVPSDFIAIGNAISPSGEPIDPAAAAERIAKVLADARHAPSAAAPASAGPDPLGVVVSTDLDLSGLRGKKLTLSWSMWQVAGGVRLSGDWLNDNLAYRIEPRTEHATTTLDVWIPLPREPGSYFVRVDLRDGPTRIDSGESERFE